MSYSDVSAIIRTFIKERFLIGRAEGFIKESESLLEKGVIDSTGILELVGFIEEKFGFSVEDEELVPDNLASIENIIKYVAKKAGVKV